MAEFDPHEGEAQTIVSLAEAAMHMYRAAIDSLPFPEDKKFQKRAEVVLTGMRKLRAALTEAASHSNDNNTAPSSNEKRLVRRILSNPFNG